MSAPQRAKDRVARDFDKDVETVDFSEVRRDDLFEEWRFDPSDPEGSRLRLVSVLRRSEGHVLMATRTADEQMRQRFKDLWDEHRRIRLALFDQINAEIQARRARSGLEALDRQVEEAFDAVNKLLAELCAWPCASLDEAWVKAKYLLEECPDELDEDLTEAFLRSLCHPRIGAAGVISPGALRIGAQAHRLTAARRDSDALRAACDRAEGRSQYFQIRPRPQDRAQQGFKGERQLTLVAAAEQSGS